jgi:putative ABC transport system permease protein
MVPVARRNLLAEKGRLAMSVFGVAFAVLLVLIVLSLYRGWSGVGKIITRLPGDVWVTQTGTNNLFRSSSFLPADRAGDLQAIPGVQLATPVYSREMGYERDGAAYNVLFMAFDAPPAATALLPQATRDRYFPEPGQIDIDSVFADKAGLHAGDTMDILGQTLRVAHVTKGGSAVLAQSAFINGADARTIYGTADMVNFYLITTQPGADAAAVQRQLTGIIPNSEVHASEAFSRALSRDVSEGFLPVVSVLVGIGIVVGGAVVALTTYTATIEKARDFGVLKALGASSAYLYRIVITQSVIVGVLGSLLGVAASAVSTAVIARRIPEFITDLRATDVAIIFVAALAMAIAASYVPVRRINSIDPAMVFRA